MTPLEPWQATGAWIVFFVVNAALTVGQIPFFRLDRTGAAFVGAVAMVFLGILTSREAFLSQDYATLGLLFSMMPIVAQWPDQKALWLLVALVSTLAGNLTLLGSIANIIVVEKARGSAHIGFRTYTRVGAPVTLFTLAFAGFYWWMRF